MTLARRILGTVILLTSTLALGQSFEVASVKAVPIDANSYKPAGPPVL